MTWKKEREYIKILDKALGYYQSASILLAKALLLERLILRQALMMEKDISSGKEIN